MESVNYVGNYVETELSDSIVLIDDLNDSNGDKVDQLCDSGKNYHSCYIHRRQNQPEDDDDDDNNGRGGGGGEAIALSIDERGTPDGKSDTDFDDEDIGQSGSRELVPGACENDDDEEEEEEEEEEAEGVKGDKEKLKKIDEGQEEEEEEEEEHIEVRTPQWTEAQILTHSESASGESSSTSECESKSTSVSFVDDSLLVTTSQQANGQVDSVGMTLTETYSDLEDKTDNSSFQELTNDDNGEMNDEEAEGEQLKSIDNIYGGPIDNKGFDTVDGQLIVNNQQQQHILKGSTEETIDLLSGELIESEDSVNLIGDEEGENQFEIEINRNKPLIYLEKALIAIGNTDDQVSLVTKHSTAYQRHAINLTDGTANICSASASSASTSSTSSRTIARRMVKSSGKAVKSFSKKITKLFK